MRILYNAHIQTLDPTLPEATAIGIQNGRIALVGSDAQVLAEAGPSDEKIDLAGKTVWPGLTDGHLHLQQYALSLQLVDCETATHQECIERVRERAQRTSPGGWIRGHGWNQNTWGGKFGTAAELDAVAPGCPVYLTAKSLHASWANSEALRLAGVDRNTPDPVGGKIERDAGGNPTGILFETAMELVENILPEPTDAEITQAIDQAQVSLWKMGVTGVHDYDRSRCFYALQELRQNDQLHLRVIQGIPQPDLRHAAEMGLRSGFGDDLLRFGSLKLFADGALGPHTAAMLEPYDNEPGNRGMLMVDSEVIFEQGQIAARAGISVAIHAIGDRANHEVLHAYAQLRNFETQNHLPHLRHRIEHVQLLHPEDRSRLAALDIIASVQPIHATSDMMMADVCWGARNAGAYAYRTLLESGAHLVFGSDAPVEIPNPFWGLHAAVTRRRHNGEPGDQGWHPEQRISLIDALKAYTTGPAYAAGMENRLGRLAKGYLADCILLPVDPFRIPAQELYQIHPEATLVAGEWVWQQE
jgi:predicted amidohydrolase YtcJ